MDKNKKYYEIIERMVKQHRKFPGCEAIIDDIINDVYAHSEVIMNSVTNESVIYSYLEKVISTSIITVPKKIGFNKNIHHAVIKPTQSISQTIEPFNISSKEQETPKEEVKVNIELVDRMINSLESHAEQNIIEAEPEETSIVEEFDDTLAESLQNQNDDVKVEELTLNENVELEKIPEEIEEEEFSEIVENTEFTQEEPILEEKFDAAEKEEDGLSNIELNNNESESPELVLSKEEQNVEQDSDFVNTIELGDEQILSDEIYEFEVNPTNDELQTNEEIELNIDNIEAQEDLSIVSESSDSIALNESEELEFVSDYTEPQAVLIDIDTSNQNTLDVGEIEEILPADNENSLVNVEEQISNLEEISIDENLEEEQIIVSDGIEPLVLDQNEENEEIIDNTAIATEQLLEEDNSGLGDELVLEQNSGNEFILDDVPDELSDVAEENDSLSLEEENLTLLNDSNDGLELDSDEDFILQEDVSDQENKLSSDFQKTDFSVFAFQKTDIEEDYDIKMLGDDLSALDEKYPNLKIASIFNLKYKQGYSVDEIVDELGMSQKEVITALTKIIDLV